MRSQNSPTDIAIVGMSALFSGARDLRTYWQNILNKVDAVHEAPDQWAKPYFEPNSTESDRIYTRKGGFLGDLAKFNPAEFGIMPNAVDGGEPDQYLALKLARDALKDAGYDQKPFNRQKTGIILGRGTYINRGYTNLLQHGMIVDQTLDLLRQVSPNLDEETLRSIRKQLKDTLPPFNPDMSPGLVPNIVSGRIANRLDLMGPNFIVDAACASSLISIELAIRELLSGRCEMVLAGGIHASTPPQIYMIFCGLAALSHSNIRPFDAAAEGTLLGEGLGVVVLKRLADAQRDQDRIYAVIKGVGSSSDGKALGLLAPRLEGEVLALQRVYEENGLDPQTVALVEAHGTGIPLGDQTEVRSLSQVFGKREGLLPYCALGSVKSLIGHCIPAAGVASVIKMALALYHKILPPTLCDRVNPALEIEKTPFYINTETRPWIHGNRKIPRRAGVNAFGFGGINAHAVLEEYTGAHEQDAKLLHHQWSTELLIFSGEERAGVVALIEKVQRIVQNNPDISLANLAYTLSNPAIGSHRLAIIAKDVPDLEKKLNVALEKLKDTKRDRLQTRTGIYYAEINPVTQQGKTAFLFPGEGGQYANMLADLCLYFPKVRAWFDFLDETFAEAREHPPSRFIFPPPTGLTDEARRLAREQAFTMDVASEIVFTASMALYELLRDLGIQCDVMVGHSTGENTALIASGTVRKLDRAQLMEKIRHLNRIYRELEVADSIPKGALLAVGAIKPSELQQLIENFAGRLHLAMDNCPNQAVLFGSESDIDAVAVQLQSAGAICRRLPFDRAYHTPLFEKVAIAFREFYDALDVGSSETDLYSCAIAAPFPEQPEAIRSLATKQWFSRVRFRETVEQLYQAGVTTFIEVGPSSNLTAFVDDILQGCDYLALASNSQRKSGLEQIQHLLARLLMNGMAVDLVPLYQHRDLSLVSLDAAISVGNGNHKASLVLDVSMPVMRLQPEFVQAIQKKNHLEPKAIPDIDVPAVRQQTPVENKSLGNPPINVPVVRQQTPVENKSLGNPLGVENQSPSHPLIVKNGSHSNPATVNNQPSSNAPISSVDTRLAIVSAHFELMQEFLANQSRVMAALHGKQNAVSYTNARSSPTGLPSTPLTHEESWPLLGKILEHDSQHLYCERCVDMERDVFLYDHTLGGQVSQRHPELHPLPVIPFTFSMEMIAEAAAYLLGGDKCVVGLYNLRGYRWLALDRTQLLLRILAQVQPQHDEQTFDVHVQVFQVSTTEANQQVLVFEGDVRLSDHFPSSPPPIAFNLEQPVPSRLSDADLYRTGMFHGSRLQGVKHIRQWSKQGIEADLQVLPIDNFFSHTQRPIFRTDAGLLDAAGQLVGYWLTEQFGSDFNCFPFQVNAFYQYAEPLPPNSRVVCRALIHFTSDRQIKADFELFDQTGRVIARFEQWQDRYFTIPQNFYQCRLHPQTSYLSTAWRQVETGLICRRLEPFPEHFLDDSWGIWKRTLAHLMLNDNEREFWYGLSEKGPRRNEWLLGRIAAKDALRQWAQQTYNLELAPVDIEIRSTQLGKPFVRCPELERLGSLPDISISHSRGYIVAAVAKPNRRIGIDIERLNFIRSDDWLTAAFTKQELELLPQPDFLPAILGLWCAKEAAAKALGTGLQGTPHEWSIIHYSSDGQQITVTHGSESFHVNLWYQEDEILAICQS
ncbi:MAG TPA: beta-ketoacyl synthase N-terminal-like domain-containing protein [Coleofasciculaceae cyanobacterium]|jgi:acyl transferase domain-containing protein/phosphopantetheinyl transferase